MGKFIDLTGQRFGRLVVVKRVENYVSPQGTEFAKFLCKCDCGNTVVTKSNTLRSNEIKSCGCLKKEMLEKRNFIDLTGMRFGKLVVIEKTAKNKYDRRRWTCKCDCGNSVDVDSLNLKSGATKSCGCLRESFIASEIKKYFTEKYSAVPEYKILKNPKTGMWLPYDIYLPKENIFIEVQGEQHYNNRYTLWNRDDNDFNNLKQRDKLKKQYAKKNGTFIEIDIRRIKTVKQAIEIIEKAIDKKKD